QGELLQHRCRKNVAVHNSKDSWVNSRRCQIVTYDTDFVSAEKLQHPELTAYDGHRGPRSRRSLGPSRVTNDSRSKGSPPGRAKFRVGPRGPWHWTAGRSGGSGRASSQTP